MQEQIEQLEKEIRNLKAELIKVNALKTNQSEEIEQRGVIIDQMAEKALYQAEYHDENFIEEIAMLGRSRKWITLHKLKNDYALNAEDTKYLIKVIETEREGV